MSWEASAPSNIALIKYMGKSDPNSNRPSNASLSYSLENLRTNVLLKKLSNSQVDTWNSVVSEKIPEAGKTKFLKHLAMLKERFDVRECFEVSSENSFPHSCGFASSASSFAALTKTFFLALKSLKNQDVTLQQMSALSRLGSGSSCRSFFSPWAVWQSEGAESVDLPYKNLIHVAVVIESVPKEVSSTEAHRRVDTSLLQKDRGFRAERRLESLVSLMKDENWKGCFETIWQEFWDMHALFETSFPSFGYMTPDSLSALKILKEGWQKDGDGPWVTMDAGPNIHLLFRPDQSMLLQDYQHRLGQFKLLVEGSLRNV